MDDAPGEFPVTATNRNGLRLIATYAMWIAALAGIYWVSLIVGRHP